MIETAEEFVGLRSSENHEEYFRAANEEAPLEVWNTVLKDYPNMAFWVAQNKTVPYEILELLANHEDPRTRHIVAMKNKLKEKLMLTLATDQDESVRMAIARHKKATLKVLMRLENDNWGEIIKITAKRISDGNHQ